MQGLGNKFLSHIRENDSILQVMCCFKDNDIVLVNGKVDPKSDIDVINVELIFSDLDQVEAELTELPPDERTEYLKSLGVNYSGLGNLIRATHDLLGIEGFGGTLRCKFFLEGLCYATFPIEEENTN